ncbi:MAG: cysteine desulfurase family protein, partial [bacterium]
MREIYMDNAAARSVLPEVLEAMSPYYREFYGNPQSLHRFGAEPAEALARARKEVAALIGASPEEIFFTSSGSESNNMAIKGLALANQDRGRHIVVSAIEHHSVLHSCKHLEKFGFDVTQVPVDSEGIVSPEALRNVLKDDTILVSVMHGNNEVGTVQKLSELSRLARQSRAVFHTDGVATVGMIPAMVDELGVDALSMAAQNFYGPKGAAALYLRKGTRIVPFMDGGVQ